MKDIDACKKVIMKGIQTLGGSNADCFIDFDFRQLFEDKAKYGDLGDKSSGTSVHDADDTLLVRCILYTLFSDKLDNLKFDDIGTGKRYRGETFNSFRFLFRWYLDEKDDDKYPLRQKNKVAFRKRLKEVLGEEKYCDFCEKIALYYHTYHYLGNFLLLYNQPSSVWTLNRAKGWNKSINDFSDLFLKEVKTKIEQGSCSNKLLNRVLSEECVHQYMKGSFTQFCKDHYLDMYVKDEGVIFYHINQSEYMQGSKQWRYQINASDECVKQYYENALSFIEDVTNRIHKRTQIMIEELNKKLNEKNL